MKIKTLFKTAAALLAVLFAVSALAVFSSAAADPTIAVSSASALAGESVTLTVSVENNPGLIGILFEIEYAEELTLTGFTTESDAIFGPGGDVTEEGTYGNPKCFSMGNDLSKTNYTYNGTYATVTFTVPATAAVGTTYTVCAKQDTLDIIDKDLKSVESFKVAAGTITVIDCRHEKLTKVDAKAATCAETGNTEYYQCDSCKALFADAEGKTATTIEAVTIAINPDAHVDLKWMLSEDGSTHYQLCANGHTINEGEHKGGEATCEHGLICEDCGTEYNKELAPHTIVKVDAKPATETEDGNIEHWTCQVCGKLFSDEAATEELETVTVPATGHKLTKVPAKAATATTDGNIEYYTCDNCGKIFKDAEGKEEITLAQTVIPKTGKPQTGDGLTIVFAAMAMVLAAAAVTTVVIVKKKVND